MELLKVSVALETLNRENGVQFALLQFYKYISIFIVNQAINPNFNQTKLPFCKVIHNC